MSNIEIIIRADTAEDAISRADKLLLRRVAEREDQQWAGVLSDVPNPLIQRITELEGLLADATTRLDSWMSSQLKKEAIEQEISQLDDQGVYQSTIDDMAAMIRAVNAGNADAAKARAREIIDRLAHWHQKANG